jgi:hypothetical protein
MVGAPRSSAKHSIDPSLFLVRFSEAVMMGVGRPAQEGITLGILDDLLGNQQLQKQYKDFVKRYEQGDPSEGYRAVW